MISLEPSKIVLMRASRIVRSIVDGPLAAGAERVRGLVAAAAEDLHGLVDDVPGRLGAEHLGHRGFEADVGLLPVHERRGEVGHRLHGEGRRGDARDLVGDRRVLSDGRAPLLALVRPRFAISSERLPSPMQLAGSVRRPVLSVVRATRRPLPSAAMMFSRGTLTLVKLMTPL